MSQSEDQAAILEAIRALIYRLPEGATLYASRESGSKTADVKYTTADGTTTFYMRQK